MEWLTSMSEIFFLNHRLLVMRSRGEPLSTTVKVGTALMLKNAEMDPKIAGFWPLQKISTGQVCYQLPKIHK